MWWRLCHKLFGWDYVLGSRRTICRIRKLPNGHEYFWYHGEFEYLMSNAIHMTRKASP